MALEEQRRLSNLFFQLTGVLFFFFKSLLHRRDKLNADKLEEVVELLWEDHGQI